MATTPASRINLAQVLGKRGFTAEANRLRKQDADQRAQAQTILDPLDVAGEYDAARLLRTTLGGQVRAITLDDLRTFAANARKLGKKFKGGITARGVVDASLAIDRDRANKDIRTSVIVRAQAGALRFVTNASPGSDVLRHQVTVDFPAFKAYAASPNDPFKLARAMLDGPLRFDCDCGRHRYWFRYIATKGGFAAGRPETGYPKIRNPNLAGVGCKHVLRTMQAVLKDASVRAWAAKMIGAAQKNDTKAQTTTAADAKAAAQKQIEQSHHLKNIAETTRERAGRISATAAGKMRAVAAAAKNAQRRASALASATLKQVEATFTKLKAAPIKKADRDALIARLMAMKTID